MILEKSQIKIFLSFLQLYQPDTIYSIYPESSMHPMYPHIITSQALKHQVHEQETLSGVGVEKTGKVLV